MSSSLEDLERRLAAVEDELIAVRLIAVRREADVADAIDELRAELGLGLRFIVRMLGQRARRARRR